jgi:uncharacterized SAM-binding protein YcdF (DUF218 family)
MDGFSTEKAPRTRWLHVLAVAALMAVLGVFGAGFVWFLQMTTERHAPVLQHADGIVALTGGAGRVEVALRLLNEGWAERLLITGIGGGTELGTLGRLTGIDASPLAGRITLGRYAASTRGNGVETAFWADQNHIRTLIVVTATYHMPRALIELQEALPDVRLIPLTVGAAHIASSQQPAEELPGWRVEASEYLKYLLAVSGLSRLLPRREASSRTEAVA